MNNNRWEVVPDEHDENEATVSADTLFADLIEGFDALSAGRVETTLATRAEDGSSVTFYNAQNDELYVMVSRLPVAASELSADGIKVDYDAQGKVVGFAVGQASSRLTDVPRSANLDRAAA